MVLSGAHLPSLMCFPMTKHFWCFFWCSSFDTKKFHSSWKYFGFFFAPPNQFSTFSAFFSPKDLSLPLSFSLEFLSRLHPFCLSPVRVWLLYMCTCLYHWWARCFHPSFLHSIIICSLSSSVLMRLLEFSYPDFCILSCMLAAVKG